MSNSENESGARPAVRRLRCLRCGCPDPAHPEANKHGGVTLHATGVCVACEDLLSRKATARAMHYRRTATGTATAQTTLTEGYE
jgi:hypothetical protein